jgi:predicted Zn-dependent protease
MMDKSEFEGGVFSDKIPNGRASATIVVNPSGVEATTNDGQRFALRYEDMQLDLGGASGRMVFCRTKDRKLTIFCEDKQFASAIEIESGSALRGQLTEVFHRRKVENRSMRNTLIIFLLGCALLLVGGYYGLMATARHAVHVVPVSVDEKIGKMAMEQMDLEGPEVENKVIVDACQKIVDRLTPHAELPGLKFELKVVDSSTVNAFCLPGGKMVVYTGLLKKAENAEQVAGVLSHEIAHATRRHGLQRITQSLGVIVAIEVMIGDVGGLVALGVELGKTAALTSYGREQEIEADVVGVKMLHAAAIDPLELANFFEMMKKDGLDVPDAIKWVASHPQHDVRISTIRGEVGKLGPQEYRPLDIDWAAVQKELGVAVNDAAKEVGQ